MKRLAYIALALALTALGGCMTLPVEFVEPVGAQIVVARHERATLPATLGISAPWQTRVEFDFDAPTLVSYGMSAEQAEALVAAGNAKIVGLLALRTGASGSAAEADAGQRFALPGAAVVRALESGERVRCWWPAEGRRRLWFEGSRDDDGAWRSLEFGEKDVTSHTASQKSAELHAVFGGAAVAVMLILLIVVVSV